jgi:hypothetical protein
LVAVAHDESCHTRLRKLSDGDNGREEQESKDEGGRMKDEGKAFKHEKLSFHPSSFRLHPFFYPAASVM